MSLTIDILRQILNERAGGVLLSGSHAKPNGECGECKVCVRELRCLALDLPWSDHPDDDTKPSPTDEACQRLNDSRWSSDAARTEACLPLALLSEETAAKGWVKRYVDRTIREILPGIFRQSADRIEKKKPEHADKLRRSADACELLGTSAVKEARDSAAAAYAAADAAAYAAAAYAAAAAAAYAAAAYTAYTAADAAAAYAAAYAAAAYAAAAYACAADNILKLSVKILIECHRGE
jgi:hypothetical protein